ncbi:hypothetical protein A0H81_06765 [Grifola frondosa]|uniref:Uncharacterized protein n=1 Tax=Grifola frondosa TaxID=5627 RepID=A0A1C7M8Z2_GRIFR|nr:hypothetical protein A0H81_06765 [Grifola frondosa]
MHASPPLFCLILNCFTLAAYAGMYEPTKRQTNITELLSPQSCTSGEQSSPVYNCVQCELSAGGQFRAALQIDYHNAYLKSCADLRGTTLPVPTSTVPTSTVPTSTVSTSTTPPGAKNTAGVDAAVSIITWAPVLVISMLLVNNL